jgi:hypothetical protein
MAFNLTFIYPVFPAKKEKAVKKYRSMEKKESRKK